MSQDIPKWIPPAEYESKKLEIPAQKPVSTEQVEISAEIKQKMKDGFSKFLSELKASPTKIFEGQYAKSANEETGTIELHTLNALFQIHKDTNISLKSIADYLSSIGGNLNGFNFEITVGKNTFDEEEYHIKLVNVGNFIREAKQNREAKTSADFDKLMKKIAQRLKEVEGRAPGSIASKYFKDSDGRIVLREWDNEISSLLPALNAHKDKFVEIMAASNRKDARFGYVDDGHPQRSWIELSWR